MALPIDQLIKPLSKDQVKSSIYNLLKATGLPVTAWQEGSVARTIIAIIAAIFAGFTEVMTLAVRAGFLDLAEGIWLTLLAKYVYGVDRIEATFATGYVLLDNAGGGLFTFDPGDVLFRSPSTNKLYTNPDAFVLNPQEAGKEVPIRAVEVGSASTAGPGQITELETTLLLVTVTNPEAVVGSDAEPDPALRERCRDALGALSPNGPEAAYVYVAKSTKRPDGTTIPVNRVWVSPSSSIGQVTVYVAGPSGPVSGDANDPATDLGMIAQAIKKRATPLCVTSIVGSAVAKPISLTIDVWIDAAAGLTDAEVDILVRKKLADYSMTIPIGGYVIPPALGKILWRALVGQIEAASPFIIEAKLNPEADIITVVPEVATFASPTINVYQVPV